MGNYEIGRTRSGLRLGFTTGSCGGSGKGGSRDALFRRGNPAGTPHDAKGNRALSGCRGNIPEFRFCALRSEKNTAGDDPDVTDGLLVCRGSKEEKAEHSSQDNEISVRISGGRGVGTRDPLGLDQASG